MYTYVPLLYLATSSHLTLLHHSQSSLVRPPPPIVSTVVQQQLVLRAVSLLSLVAVLLRLFSPLDM